MIFGTNFKKGLLNIARINNIKTVQHSRLKNKSFSRTKPLHFCWPFERLDPCLFQLFNNRPTLEISKPDLSYHFIHNTEYLENYIAYDQLVYHSPHILILYEHILPFE